MKTTDGVSEVVLTGLSGNWMDDVLRGDTYVGRLWGVALRCEEDYEAGLLRAEVSEGGLMVVGGLSEVAPNCELSQPAPAADVMEVTRRMLS